MRVPCIKVLILCADKQEHIGKAFRGCSAEIITHFRLFLYVQIDLKVYPIYMYPLALLYGQVRLNPGRCTYVGVCAGQAIYYLGMHYLHTYTQVFRLRSGSENLCSVCKHHHRYQNKSGLQIVNEIRVKPLLPFFCKHISNYCRPTQHLTKRLLHVYNLNINRSNKQLNNIQIDDRLIKPGNRVDT